MNSLKSNICDTSQDIAIAAITIDSDEIRHTNVPPSTPPSSSPSSFPPPVVTKEQRLAIDRLLSEFRSDIIKLGFLRHKKRMESILISRSHSSTVGTKDSNSVFQSFSSLKTARSAATLEQTKYSDFMNRKDRYDDYFEMGDDGEVVEDDDVINAEQRVKYSEVEDDDDEGVVEMIEDTDSIIESEGYGKLSSSQQSVSRRNTATLNSNKVSKIHNKLSYSLKQKALSRLTDNTIKVTINGGTVKNGGTALTIGSWYHILVTRAASGSYFL